MEENFPGKAPTGADGQLTLLLGVPATMITAGAVLSFIGAVEYPPLDGGKIARMALIAGGAAGVVYTAAGFLFLRGKSAGWKAMAILPAVSLLGFAAITLGGALVLNGALDDSPESQAPAAVMGKEKVSFFARGLGKSSYRLDVSSWEAPGKVERLFVEKEIHEKATPFQDMAVVRVKSGAFGFAWIVSLEVVPGPGEGGLEPQNPAGAAP